VAAGVVMRRAGVSRVGDGGFMEEACWNFGGEGGER